MQTTLPEGGGGACFSSRGGGSYRPFSEQRPELTLRRLRALLSHCAARTISRRPSKIKNNSSNDWEGRNHGRTRWRDRGRQRGRRGVDPQVGGGQHAQSPSLPGSPRFSWVRTVGSPPRPTGPRSRPVWGPRPVHSRMNRPVKCRTSTLPHAPQQ